MSSSTLILLAVIAVVVLWAISVYNGLVSMRQRVNAAFADVDVQLRQRHDLIPNLVETVKGYAAHERGTLDEVVKARRGRLTNEAPRKLVRAFAAFDRMALTRLAWACSFAISALNTSKFAEAL